MAKILITSDLHLTDRPQDAYRFDIFPWLLHQAGVTDADTIAILGDLTDRKDNHSGWLINRVIAAVTSLASRGHTVVILMGNHDYADPQYPTFQFLGDLKTGHITYVQQPDVLHGPGTNIVAIPHGPNPVETFTELATDTEGADLVLLHHTFDRAVASNGVALPGLSQDSLKLGAGTKCVSGDIHVPQKLGRVIYCGSPYHVHFGDSFTPRVLLYDNGKITSTRYQTLSRHRLDVTSAAQIAKQNVKAGDQVKVSLHLRRAEFVDWAMHRQHVIDVCKQLRLELFEIRLVELETGSVREKGAGDDDPATDAPDHDPDAVFDVYCKKTGIPDHSLDYQVGEYLLQGDDDAA